MDFAAQFEHYRKRVEHALQSHLPPATTPPARLHTAMRYSMESGGKRLRPVLLLAAADLFGDHANAAEPAALAIECIHTYSLIHDDLPCMDNDDLRRGRPTAHKQFDEATALLAGDALLTYAFSLLATAGMPPRVSVDLLRELSAAAGSEQLIGGQMEDLLAEKKATATTAELRGIHLKKTAAMISAALVMGALVGQANSTDVNRLRTAGLHLGLAFQINDDILDATADTATLGKTAGKDAKADKTTYVKLHGLAAARVLAREETDAALAALARLPGNTDFLVALVNTMAARTN